MSIDTLFLGSGWGFPPEFDKGARGVGMVSQEDDIQQSLMILFSTLPGERVMRPTYGCDLKSLVFEDASESMFTEIKDILERAILFFEPRIHVDRIDLYTEEIYQGLIKIKLHYTIRKTNSRTNMVYPFYFQESSDMVATQ